MQRLALYGCGTVDCKTDTFVMCAGGPVPKTRTTGSAILERGTGTGTKGVPDGEPGKGGRGSGTAAQLCCIR